MQEMTLRLYLSALTLQSQPPVIAFAFMYIHCDMGQTETGIKRKLKFFPLRYILKNVFVKTKSVIAGDCFHYLYAFTCMFPVGLTREHTSTLMTSRPLRNSFILLLVKF